MLTMRGYVPVGVMPTGRVRNASTSNLLSFDTNVNDATSASRFDPRTAAFKSVNFRGFADPSITYQLRQIRSRGERVGNRVPRDREGADRTGLVDHVLR